MSELCVACGFAAHPVSDPLDHGEGRVGLETTGATDPRDRGVPP